MENKPSRPHLDIGREQRRTDQHHADRAWMGRAEYPLRLIFMGTPDFSVPVLADLMTAGHEIICVYSQPPRPAGRGKKDRPSPVQIFAEENGLPVFTPKNFKDPADLDAFRNHQADAAIVVAYGLILPREVLEAPRLGCINVHASLLPRWRGAAPIQRAIEAGDDETGVTIMMMAEGLDTGPMLASHAVPIGDDMTAGALHDQLSVLGGPLAVHALDGLTSNTLAPDAQPEAGVTYAAKIRKEEGEIDWRTDAQTLDRRIRALTPWPGMFFRAPGRSGESERIKIVSAVLEGDPETQCGKAGTVIAQDATIACGRGAVRLVTVQRAGKGPGDIASFLNGFPLPVGTQLQDSHDQPAAPQ